jgi:hypothetical protein
LVRKLGIRKSQLLHIIENYERHTIETLINEEALLFAKYLRNEKKDWQPRIGITEQCPEHKQPTFGATKNQ